MSILSRLTQADIRESPFPHTVRENYYDNITYHWLRQERPILSSNNDENRRHDMNAGDILRNKAIPKLWRIFIKEHVKPEFWQQIVSLYGDHIRALYPTLESKIGPLADAETCVRQFDAQGRLVKGKAPIMLDCQIGINTPSKTTSRVRGPHVDNPCELFAAMLYMKEPDDNAGGDLVLYKPKGEVKFRGKAEVDDALVEPVATVPYAANTVVTFLNSPNAIHGVTPRLASDKPRLLVNIIAEVRFPLFSIAR